MRLILLRGDAIAAEFGFFRLDQPPRVVLFCGETYALSHPLTNFEPGGGREIVGWHYRKTAPLQLRVQDQIDPAIECQQGGILG